MLGLRLIGGSQKGRKEDEEDAIYGGADRSCASASGGRDTGAGGDPQARCISEQTFYRWKRKFEGMGVAELTRLGIIALPSGPVSLAS